MKKVLFVLWASLAFAQSYTCPQYQNWNGLTGSSAACVFTSNLDSPAFLTQQNSEIAASLNSVLPNGPGVAFEQTYGNLPQSQQTLVMACDQSILNNEVFNTAILSTCPLLAPGILDVSTLIAQNPAPTNPGNGPSVTWNGTQFVPVVPPQPGTPTLVAPAPVTTGIYLVGTCYSTNCYPGPASYSNGKPTVTDGQQITQNGVIYTAHLTNSMFNTIQVTYTKN